MLYEDLDGCDGGGEGSGREAQKREDTHVHIVMTDLTCCITETNTTS